MNEKEKIDKIIEYIEKNKHLKSSRYNLLNYDDITYEYWIKVDDILEFLEEER